MIILKSKGLICLESCIHINEKNGNCELFSNNSKNMEFLCDEIEVDINGFVKIFNGKCSNYKQPE